MIDRAQMLLQPQGSTSAASRYGVPATPQTAQRSLGGQAALNAVTQAKQQYGHLPGMDRFFAQPGMSAENPIGPRTTMHSGPGTPGLRRAYLSLLSGQGSNNERMGHDPGVSLRDMRAIYGGNASIGDASNLRYIAPLIGLQHIYSGQGSGQW